MCRRMGLNGSAASFLVVALVAASLPLLPATGMARERVYLGLGISGVGVSDGFDGTTTIRTQENETVYPGELENGGGLHGVFGAMLSELFAVEIALDLHGHEATHQAFPGIKKDAGLAAISAGTRVIGGFGDSFEYFGRAALGAYTLTYKESVQLPFDTVPRDDAEFSGVGLQLGGGAAMLLGPVGLELSLTHHAVNFTSVTTPFAIRRISGSDAAFNAITFTVFYHFTPGGGSGSSAADGGSAGGTSN